MGKRKYKKDRVPEWFQWAIFAVVFFVIFVISMIWNFTANCVFEWPLRFDVATCWDEQKPDAKEDATDAASNFMPKLKY